MPPKVKGYDASITVRMPPELKTRCSDEAKKESLTVNEWINRKLESTLAHSTDDIISDDEIDLWYTQEFTAKKYDTIPKPTREEFLERAAKELAATFRCPHCGHMNLGDAKYCSGCGEEISWTHPDTPAADRIYEEFIRAAPYKKPSFHYVLSSPSQYSRGLPFLILEADAERKGKMTVIKEIRTDELVKMREKIEKEREEEGEK